MSDDAITQQDAEELIYAVKRLANGLIYVASGDDFRGSYEAKIARAICEQLQAQIAWDAAGNPESWDDTQALAVALIRQNLKDDTARKVLNILVEEIPNLHHARPSQGHRQSVPRHK